MVFKVKGMNEATREMSVEERRCPKAEPHNISGLEDRGTSNGDSREQPQSPDR